MRYKVDPRDVPAEKAARRLGITEKAFRDALGDLQRRGFPQADETTGMYDLKAIDAWCDKRNPQLFLTTPTQARDARAIAKQRLGM